MQRDATDSISGRRSGPACGAAAVILAACLSFAPTGIPAARADDTPSGVRTEVRSLLARLAESDCRFKRNGSWYTAAEARDHLQQKYDYGVAREAIPSTEAFIERAASRSSVSGRAYWVKCPGRPPVQSRTWLMALLATLRSDPRNGR